MSVSVTQHKNFVGGEWVDAASGETMEVLNPSTGEVIAEVPRADAEDVERAVEAARKAFADWSEKTPKDRMELLLKLADVIDENADELTQLESQNVGKPMSIAGDEMPFSADNLRFFAGAARTLEGKAAGEYVEGYTSIIRREPLGIVAGITPWNYPLMMAVWKLGPGARRRQRPDPEAGRADAADDAPLRRAGAGVPAAGRAAGDHRRRRPRGRGARPPRRDQADLADRLGRDRQADRGRRGAEQPQARPPRARRQGADGRARRRRPGHGRRGDQDRRLLELGPGLHRVLAHPRPREDLRRRHVRDGQGARGDEGRRPGRGRGRRHGPRDLARAAGARARLPRARRRREGDGRHRRRGDRRPRLLRQADRRRRRRSRTRRSSRTRSSARS